MEMDTHKKIAAYREEEERQKQRDEKKLIEEFYGDYLAQKHT